MQEPSNDEINQNVEQTLFQSNAESSVKIDGTNVGLSENGTLWGRRIQIEDKCNSYMKCDIKFLRNFNMQTFKAKISSAISQSLDEFVFTL